MSTNQFKMNDDVKNKNFEDEKNSLIRAQNDLILKIVSESV